MQNSVQNSVQYSEQPAARPLPTTTPTAPIIDADENDDTPAGDGLISQRKRAAWRNAAEVLVMFLILAGLLNFLTAEAAMTGMSMTPALSDGQHVLASRITYVLVPPARGDVVVLRDPLNPARMMLRRVIGLPGEHLELRGRQVLVNGRVLNEPYIDNPLTIGDNLTATAQLQIPENQYYVMGDNRLSINDSRSWGPVNGEEILGRAWLSYWPPESIGFVQHERYEEQPR